MSGWNSRSRKPVSRKASRVQIPPSPCFFFVKQFLSLLPAPSDTSGSALSQYTLSRRRLERNCFSLKKPLLAKSRACAYSIPPALAPRISAFLFEKNPQSFTAPPFSQSPPPRKKLFSFEKICGPAFSLFCAQGKNREPGLQAFCVNKRTGSRIPPSPCFFFVKQFLSLLPAPSDTSELPRVCRGRVTVALLIQI